MPKDRRKEKRGRDRRKELRSKSWYRWLVKIAKEVNK